VSFTPRSSTVWFRIGTPPSTSRAMAARVASWWISLAWLKCDNK